MAKNKNKQRKKSTKSQNKKPKTITKVVYKDKPMSIGAMLGDGLQKIGESVFKRITGSGDYKMSPNISNMQENSLFMNAKNQPPSFSNGMSSFVFEHSEYIGDVISSSTPGAFEIDTFNVSPSDPACFPWLSGIADNFQQYEVEGMIFRFESTSGTSVASTNTALGNVMGLFSYDYSDPLPINKQAFLQYDGCVDARASESFLVGVECAKSSLPFNKLYIGTPASGTDPRMNYKGKFVIASNGIPGASVNLGELWVHYRIRMNIASAPGINSIGGILDQAYMRMLDTQVATSIPWGVTSGALPNVIASTGISVSVPSPMTLTVTGADVGRVYQITHTVWGSSTSTYTTSPLGGSAATGTGLLIYQNATQNQVSTSGSTSTRSYVCTALVRATSEVFSVFYTTFTLGGGSFSGTVIITKMDAGIFP